ncbi:MAG: hypothetical protein EXR71_20315 [Myxococcales bacterium]|nr:hypothetical protein [Myxococcales bacterium]
MWGSTYYAIRVALEAFPPFGMAAVRLVAAGAVLLAWGRWNGEAWPRRASLGPLALAGVLMFLGGNGSVVWAQQSVSSGLVAVLVGVVPLYTAAAGLCVGERVSLPQWGGIALGVGGIVVLQGDQQLSGDVLVTGVLTVGSIAWTLGSLASKLQNETTPTMSSGVQMLAGGVLLGVAAVATDEPIPSVWPLRSVLAVLYLFSFGSVLAFSAYTWLLRNTSLALATSYAYVNPVVAVLIGIVFGGEVLAREGWLGLVMIVAAVGLVTRKR